MRSPSPASIPANTPFAGDPPPPATCSTNDTDVDTGATKTVARSTASAGNVGTAVTGTYGSVTINSDGSYTYTLDNSDTDTNALAQGASVTECSPTRSPTSTAPPRSPTLTITITGTNDGPVAVADTNAGDAVTESGVNPGNTPFAGDASAAGNVLGQRHRRRHRRHHDRLRGQRRRPATSAPAVTGTYGSVTINSDGSYTYTLDNADPDTNALAQGAVRRPTCSATR